jgi:hypothetical protein
MCPLHVFVSLSSATKCLHTEPADVDPTRDALHVIATKRFLNRHPALGAVSRYSLQLRARAERIGISKLSTMLRLTMHLLS